jgi:hypothetical protein
MMDTDMGWRSAKRHDTTSLKEKNMKKTLTLVAIIIASLSAAACNGSPNNETAVALAEMKVAGKAVYSVTDMPDSNGTTTVFVCTENSVVPVTVSGSASAPKVEGSRTAQIAACGKPQELWQKYNEALTSNWKAEKAKAAMAALEEAIK